MRINLQTTTEAAGYIVYRGPSQINGSPIVVIVTGFRRSRNKKTGDMLQSYILCDSDQMPTEAVETGLDEAICGDCRHRKVDGAGSCYVNLGQGPYHVYHAMRAGAYLPLSPAEVGELIDGRLIRVGTYGDPAAVPVAVWEALIAKSSGWTGYTHQWRKATDYRHFLMASVDSDREADVAKAKGWRWFRVKDSSEPIRGDEIVCPASAEAGKRLQCNDCLVCDGSRNNGRRSVVINAHGMHFKISRWKKARAAMKQKKRFRITSLNE